MSFTMGALSQSSCYRRRKEGRPVLRPLLSGERGAFGDLAPAADEVGHNGRQHPRGPLELRPFLAGWRGPTQVGIDGGAADTQLSGVGGPPAHIICVGAAGVRPRVR